MEFSGFNQRAGFYGKGGGPWILSNVGVPGLLFTPSLAWEENLGGRGGDPTPSLTPLVLGHLPVHFGGG